MYSALIVSSSQKASQRIREWLGAEIETLEAATVAQAALLLGARRFSLIIVNTPLPDGDGLALYKQADAGVLILAPQADYEEIRRQMEPRGVLTLAKPLSPALFMQAVSLLAAARVKIDKLQGKLEEVRAVDRAKWALMQTLKMNEAQAHRYIEKQAMDLRITKRAVAENIIRTYEN